MKGEKKKSGAHADVPLRRTKRKRKEKPGVPHGSEIEIRDVDGMEYREKGRRRATCLPDCSVGYVKLLENVGVPRINDERERAWRGPETRFHKRGAPVRISSIRSLRAMLFARCTV